MKVSGEEIAAAILKKLALQIKSKNLHPGLAIILANDDPASRIYVKNKIITAQSIGVDAKLYQFSKQQQQEVINTIKKLNLDQTVNGMIIQYPVYPGWDFHTLEENINPQKDVDGFLDNSPYDGATALGVWEMLTAFAKISGFKKTVEFLKEKKIVVVGKGKAAGGPIFKLLTKKGLHPVSVVKETLNPTPIIQSADVVISAAGVKNLINKSNLKKDSFVIGVGVGKEIIDGKQKIFGDINEEEVAKIAKLYCPTIGGIGPLTIVSLLKNVVRSASRSLEKT